MRLNSPSLASVRVYQVQADVKSFASLPLPLSPFFPLYTKTKREKKQEERGEERDRDKSGTKYDKERLVYRALNNPKSVH